MPPVTINAVSAQVEAQLFEKLAEVGMGLNTVGDAGFVPVLATGWTWAPDSLSIAFHIDPKARWHDGAPVTANDVRFTWQLYADSATGSLVRPLILSIDSVTVRDSLTAVVWFSRRTPEQFLDAAWQMRDPPAARARLRPPRRDQERAVHAESRRAAVRSSSRGGKHVRRSCSTRTRTTISAVRISTM